MPIITAIDATTWQFDEEGVRFFLLAGTERALLLDSGMFTHDALDLARGLTDLPIELLNTHADRDHTGSNAQFDHVYMSLAETTNYYNSPAGGNAPAPTGAVIGIWDGQVIDLGARELEVIALPGHTPGSVAILDRRHRRLFSGDPIQRNGNIYMFGPQREMHAYVGSLERLLTRIGAFDEIYPCHADCPLTPEVIPQLIEGAKRVLTGAVDGEDFEIHGRTVSRVDVGVSAFLCEKRG